LESVLCRLTGAEAATAVHSYCGAVWLALAALAHGHDVLVARADVGDVEGGNSLANLAAAAGASLQEVGATNRTTATDYLSAASPRTPALLSLSADNYRVIGDTAMPSLEELIAVARERELCFIDALGGAPLVEPPVSIDWPRRSAAASIAAGTNVTILRGDGLVGGPACGLLLGDKQSIQQIVSHPLFSLIRLDPLRSAAVLATAECYDSPSRGADSIPVWQCLGTSLDNLRNRAERMAAQLGHVSGVTSATAVESRSPLFASLSGDGFPSYGVALTPEDGNVAALHARLGQARIPIVARPEKEQLVLDLRTVPPRHDKVIVDSLLS
jgi:L-seryl-tRNA(Ser) seleniumtransferase